MGSVPHSTLGSQLVWMSLTLQSKVKLLEINWRSVFEIGETLRASEASGGSSGEFKPYLDPFIMALRDMTFPFRMSRACDSQLRECRFDGI